MKNQNKKFSNGARPFSANPYTNTKNINDSRTIPEKKNIRPVSAAVFRSPNENDFRDNDKDITRQTIKTTYDFDSLKNLKDFSQNTTQLIYEKPVSDYNEYLFLKPKKLKNNQVFFLPNFS